MKMHRPILLSLTILAASGGIALAECASKQMTMASTATAEPVVVATVVTPTPPAQPVSE